MDKHPPKSLKILSFQPKIMDKHPPKQLKILGFQPNVMDKHPPKPLKILGFQPKVMDKHSPKPRGVNSQQGCWESQQQGQISQQLRNVQMGTLPATRSQQGCWEIGAGAGSQMGTAGSQNSGGSQQGCWEPNGNNLEARKSSGSQQGCWEPTRRREIWPAAGANIFN